MKKKSLPLRNSPIPISILSSTQQHTASSVNNVQAAIEHIFPLVYEFRKKRAADDPKVLKAAALAAAAAAAALEKTNNAAASATAASTTKTDKDGKPKQHNPLGHAKNDPTDDIMYVSDIEDDDDLIEEDYGIDEDDEEEVL